MSEADRIEGGAAKRHKTSDDDDKEALMRRIEELSARNDELESEIRVLRGEENHDDSLLPVVVKRTTTTTVDLSRVDPSLVVQVASFVGLSRELLNLALTCKSFGWRRPSSTLGSSLIEEVARQFLVNQLRPSDVERNALPQYGNDTIVWLPILYELERLRLPLRFSKLVGRGIEYSGSESIVTSPYEDISTAFANYVMKRGVHYATFKLVKHNYAIIVGVARPIRDFGFVNEESGFDMYDERHFGNLLAQRTDAWVGNVHYCQLYCGDSDVGWTDLLTCQIDEEEGGLEGFGEGDIVGLSVDLNEGSLSVYKNGRNLGVAKDGLAGEYCFFSALCEDGEISIERETPPR